MRFFIVFFIIVSGCTGSRIFFTPDSMWFPKAIKGSSYINSIEVKGGAIRKTSISVSITPVDSGLMWKPGEVKGFFEGKMRVKEDYHYITIYGTPRKQGVISIKISGFTLGTSSPGKDFNKEYRIEVIK